MPRYEHVVCPFCALLCDDLAVEVDGETVVSCTGCGAATEQFLSALAQQPSPTVEGVPTSLDAAVTRAVDLLAGARRPLILLLGHQSNEAAGAAAALAQRLGGILDGAEGLATTLDCIATAGLASATLGEVRNRADVVVCWRADPLTTHPRLLERVVDAAGVYRPDGRAGRTVVAVGGLETATAGAADLVLTPDAGAASELLWALRLLVKDAAAVPLAPTVAGLPWEQVAHLAGLMLGATYGALFYADTPDLSTIEVEGLLRLSDELNAVSRWAAFVLPSAPNAWGTAAALAAATGYGHAVWFEGTTPRHDGTPLTALLQSSAADALLVVGAPPGADLPLLPAVASHEPPLVVVEGRDSPLGRRAAVCLPVAPPGVATGGTMGRLDRVTLPLRPLVPSPWPPDAMLLHRLLEEVARRGG